jgi:N6-adenosine-specific RNA methylase IME4
MKYRTIVADPPWYEKGGGAIKRGADRHYPLLWTPAIAAVMLDAPVWEPAPNAHLWLWTTNNYLPDALGIVDRLGFRYVTMLTWAKDRIGLGRYLRGQTEHCLFATRGSLAAAVRTESTLLVAPRGRHGAKPEAFYDRVERISPPPRLEMFARSPRPGWTVWGNEAPHESEARTQTHMDLVA